MNKIPVVIFGATGYSGEELVKRLAGHPFAALQCLTSRRYAGKKVSSVFSWINRHSQLAEMEFVKPDVSQLKSMGIQFAFLALPHGVALELAAPLLEVGIRVLDLSADFRVKDPAVYQYFYKQKHPTPALLAGAVYGLPEVYRNQIANAELVACPGCYPTSVLLPVLPLVRAGVIRPSSIIANSLSGVSGSGRRADVELLFVECNESMRPYALPAHRHMSEIEQEISVAAGENVAVQFAPHLVPLNRGIVTTIHADLVRSMEIAELTEIYESIYGAERFIRLLGPTGYPDTKNVAFTNHIEIAWRVDPRTGRVILMSAEDNLMKGASGQAIQCFNIMNGWEEDCALGC